MGHKMLHEQPVHGLTGAARQDGRHCLAEISCQRRAVVALLLLPELGHRDYKGRDETEYGLQVALLLLGTQRLERDLRQHGV